MESFIRSPNPLKDNMPKSWTIWKEEFLIFMDLLDYMNRSQSFKANLFKNLIGTVGLETINKLSFECAEDRNNLDILLKKLDNYYNPQQTEVQRRYNFFSSSMKSDETIENYIQNLKEKAKECDFGNLTDSMIRDVVILHTYDKVLRQKYLQEDNLNCNKIVQIYKDHQTYEKEKKLKNQNVQPRKERQKTTDKEKELVNVKSIQKCWRCQTQHQMRKCPAWNYKCMKCNMPHHFEKCCKNQNSKPQYTSNNIDMNNLNINKEKSANEAKEFYNVSK